MTEKENDVTWALDLLTSKEEYEHSAFPYGYPIALGVIGFTVACGANLMTKRPAFSGNFIFILIFRHLIFAHY